MNEDPPPDPPINPPAPSRAVLRGPRLLAMVAGLAAGLAAWGAGEFWLDFFPPDTVRGDFGSKLLVASPETKGRAEIKNATLAFAALGGLLGLGLGLAGGAARRSSRAAIAAGLAGLVLATIATVPTSAAILGACHERRLTLPQDELTFAVPLHAALWGPLGAMAGLAFGLGTGTRGGAIRGLVGGLVGALAGVVVFDLAGAALFPMAETVKARSLTPGSRLMARLAVACCCALGAALLVAPADAGRPDATSDIGGR